MLFDHAPASAALPAATPAAKQRATAKSGASGAKAPRASATPAARAAAAADRIEVPVGTLREILTKFSNSNAELARVIPQCSFLVNSVICHDFDSAIIAGSEIDVLPKFAGG